MPDDQKCYAHSTPDGRDIAPVNFLGERNQRPTLSDDQYRDLRTMLIGTPAQILSMHNEYAVYISRTGMQYAKSQANQAQQWYNRDADASDPPDIATRITAKLESAGVGTPLESDPDSSDWTTDDSDGYDSYPETAEQRVIYTKQTDGIPYTKKEMIRFNRKDKNGKVVSTASQVLKLTNTQWEASFDPETCINQISRRADSDQKWKACLIRLNYQLTVRPDSLTKKSKSTLNEKLVRRQQRVEDLSTAKRESLDTEDISGRDPDSAPSGRDPDFAPSDPYAPAPVAKFDEKRIEFHRMEGTWFDDNTEIRIEYSSTGPVPGWSVYENVVPEYQSATGKNPWQNWEVSSASYRCGLLEPGRSLDLIIQDCPEYDYPDDWLQVCLTTRGQLEEHKQYYDCVLRMRLAIDSDTCLECNRIYFDGTIEKFVLFLQNPSSSVNLPTQEVQTQTLEGRFEPIDPYDHIARAEQRINLTLRSELLAEANLPGITGIDLSRPSAEWNLPAADDLSSWRNIFSSLLILTQPGHRSHLNKFINQDLFERPAEFLFRLNFRELYARLLVQNNLVNAVFKASYDSSITIDANDNPRDIAVTGELCFKCLSPLHWKRECPYISLSLHDKIWNAQGELIIPPPVNPNTGLRTMSWYEQLQCGKLSNTQTKDLRNWLSKSGLLKLEEKGRRKGYRGGLLCNFSWLIREAEKLNLDSSVIATLQNLQARFQPDGDEDFSLAIQLSKGKSGKGKKRTAQEAGM